MHTILHQHRNQRWSQPLPLPCDTDGNESENTEDAVPQGYEGRVKGANNMDLDTFVIIFCIISFVVGGIVEHHLNKNVYIKSKYQRGRYIEAPRNKKGAKK